MNPFGIVAMLRHEEGLDDGQRARIRAQRAQRGTTCALCGAPGVFSMNCERCNPPPGRQKTSEDGGWFWGSTGKAGGASATAVASRLEETRYRKPPEPVPLPAARTTELGKCLQTLMQAVRRYANEHVVAPMPGRAPLGNERRRGITAGVKREDPKFFLERTKKPTRRKQVAGNETYAFDRAPLRHVVGGRGRKRPVSNVQDSWRPCNSNDAAHPRTATWAKLAPADEKVERMIRDNSKWARLERRALRRKNKQIEHLLSVLEEMQKEEIARQVKVWGLAGGLHKRRRAMAQLMQEESEAADRVMRILEEYRLLSTVEIATYLSTTITQLRELSQGPMPVGGRAHPLSCSATTEHPDHAHQRGEQARAEQRAREARRANKPDVTRGPPSQPSTAATPSTRQRRPDTREQENRRRELGVSDAEFAAELDRRLLTYKPAAGLKRGGGKDNDKLRSRAADLRASMAGPDAVAAMQAAVDAMQEHAREPPGAVETESAEATVAAVASTTESEEAAAAAAKEPQRTQVFGGRAGLGDRSAAFWQKREPTHFWAGSRERDIPKPAKHMPSWTAPHYPSLQKAKSAAADAILYRLDTRVRRGSVLPSNLSKALMCNLSRKEGNRSYSDLLAQPMDLLVPEGEGGRAPSS